MAGNYSDQNLATDLRRIAVVIVATVLIWMFVQMLGAELNWPPKYVFLADLSAAAGFIWSMIAAAVIWRKSRNE